MKVLVVGSGGREHAIIHALAQSPRIEQLYAAPGNAGISQEAVCVPIAANDVAGMVDFAVQQELDLVVVAPEDPLALGMVDALEAAGIRAFGPRRNAAVLEASKIFSKNLMARYGIPTAEYQTFLDMDDAVTYLDGVDKFPVVIKADGLALGKGVIIAHDRQEALQAVTKMMQDQAFGAAGGRIVVEEFLTGPEITVLAFCDGKTLLPMVSSRDHKPVFDGNKGPNTGGMGTIAPNPAYTTEMARECKEKIFLPTVRAMQEEGRPFKGVIYFGLMATPQGVKVIEYNARFGDPETQVVLPLLKNDLLDVFEAVVDERLDQVQLQFKPGCAVCVCLASGGYPGSYEKGKPITGIAEAEALSGVQVYHAGTKWEGETLVTNGGRVLGVTAVAGSREEAIAQAYDGVSHIYFEGMQYRADIGR